MKKIRLFFCLALLVPVFFQSHSQSSFIHYATEDNIEYSYTYIDDQFANNDSSKLVFVTHNLTPEGEQYGEMYNAVLGVWYDDDPFQWGIFNEAFFVNFQDTTAYNVLLLDSSDVAYTHLAEASTLVSGYTILDHPAINGDSSAVFIVTQNYNPKNGCCNIFNNEPIGVWYYDVTQRWYIYVLSAPNIPENSAYNIYIPPDSVSFFHTAHALNTIDYYTLIDHEILNDNPDALILITQVWNPLNNGEVENEHNVGVMYVELQNKWAIYNEDLVNLPANASFSVTIIDDGIELDPGPVSLINNDINNNNNLYVIPNPITTNATIQFYSDTYQKIQLDLYDLQGRFILNLTNGIYNIGNHSIDFNSSQLNNGIYILRLSGSNISKTSKIQVIK